MRKHTFIAAVALIAAPLAAAADGPPRSPVMDTYYGPTYSHTIFMGGEVVRQLLGRLPR